VGTFHKREVARRPPFQSSGELRTWWSGAHRCSKAVLGPKPGVGRAEDKLKNFLLLALTELRVG
jgi:hypothetical protein